MCCIESEEDDVVSEGELAEGDDGEDGNECDDKGDDEGLAGDEGLSDEGLVSDELVIVGSGGEEVAGGETPARMKRSRRGRDRYRRCPVLPRGYMTTSPHDHPQKEEQVLSDSNALQAQWGSGKGTAKTQFWGSGKAKGR